MNNTQNGEYVFEELIDHYETLETLQAKLDYVEDLKILLKNTCLLKSLPKDNF